MADHLAILKRLGPDPAPDDFDALYRGACDESIVAFLATIQPPKDLTSILASHASWLRTTFVVSWHRSTRVIEAILSCRVRWEEADAKKLGRIRRSLLKIRDDYDLKRLVYRLAKPETCAPKTHY